MAKLGKLLTGTIITGFLAAGATPAMAQDSAAPASPPDSSTVPPPGEGAAPAPATSSGSGDIVITGSRIPQPNLTSASPVTVLNSQDIKLQGTTRTEDLINSLPQSFAAQGSNISNGATGIATINLRGLGSQRTMVLINGRRLMSGDPRQLVADVNFVPAALVKRVDVLTGGASSVYGADAVAGVVNFIMDTNFRGLRIDAQASTFMHYNDTSRSILNANAVKGFRPPHGMSTNGGAQDIAAAFGAGFDDNRGSITAYATYRRQDPVLQATRDYSFCALAARAARHTKDAADPAGTERDYNCGGSATSAPGTFFTNVGVFHVAGNQFANGQVPFNFSPYNYYQRPDERYTLGAFAEYQISSGASPYLEAMFMDDHSDAQIAPSGDFANTTTLNCDNPLLSNQQFNTICVPTNTFVDAQGVTRAISYTARRNVEGGGRDDDLEHTAWRLTAGVKGDLLKGLSYDAYYQFGTSRLSETYLNDFSITRMTRALDVVANPAVGGVAGVAAGTPVCRAALPGSGPGGAPLDVNCVPWNIFVTGGVTQAALDYLQTPGFQQGYINETIANANFTVDGGEYGIQTPWSDRGIGLNFGGEYRKELLHYTTDIEFQTGDLAGQGTSLKPVDGHFDVREAFAELQIPIVSHSLLRGADGRRRLPLFGLQGRRAPFQHRHLQAVGGVRPDPRYPGPGELQPGGARAERGRIVRAAGGCPWRHHRSVRRRGSDGDPRPVPADRGHRSTVRQHPAQPGEPVQRAVRRQSEPVAGDRRYLYGGGGAAAAVRSGARGQRRLVQDRRPRPYQPRHRVPDGHGAVPQRRAAVQPDPSRSGQRVAVALARRLHREHDPQRRRARTSGIDVNASYSHRLGGLGSLSASLVGTYVQKLIFEPLPDGVGGFDCRGFFGATCTTPTPKWRHKFRLGFTMPNGLGISGQWRYFSSVRNDTLSDDPDLNGTGTPHSNPGNAKYRAKSFFDLALTARLADRYNFRLGANNILDTEPPVSGQEVTPLPYGTGNTFPQVYDALGRYLFAGVTVDF